MPWLLSGAVSGAIYEGLKQPFVEEDRLGVVHCSTHLFVGMMLRLINTRVNETYKDHLDGLITSAGGVDS